MGNNICHVLGNNDSPRFPCRLQIGTSAAINLSTGVCDKNCDGSLEENYSVLYNIDGSTCDLYFGKLVHDGNVRTLRFSLKDKKCLNFDMLVLSISVGETNISLTSSYTFTLRPNYVTVGTIRSQLPRRNIRDIKWTKTNRTNDAYGGLTETKVYFYSNENRVCLVVLECKNPRNSDEVDAVTVAHYFTNSNRTAFNPTEAADMGLSVITKTSLSNGKLDTTVEGPVQHPSSALLYMFDQVYKTGIWKPKMCPHCNSIQRGRMFWQSDSEDSDSGSIPLRHHSSQQDATSITNDGKFRGNGTGCIINNSKIIYRTRYGRPEVMPYQNSLPLFVSVDA